MTSGTEGFPAAAAPEPKPNPFARLAGVFFSPGQTFGSIARKPDWIVPLVIILIISVGSAIVAAQKIDFGTAIRAQLEQRKDMSAEQMDRAIKLGSGVGKAFTYFSPLLAVIVFIIIAALLLLASRLFGGEGGFKQAFAVTLYAWMPLIVKSVILTSILAVKGFASDPQQLATAVRSNLGFLVDFKTQPMAFSLLSSLDLFAIWTLILFVIGFAAFSRLSKVRAATIIVSLWIVTVLFRLIPAAIQAAKLKG